MQNKQLLVFDQEQFQSSICTTSMLRNDGKYKYIFSYISYITFSVTGINRYHKAFFLHLLCLKSHGQSLIIKFDRDGIPVDLFHINVHNYDVIALKWKVTISTYINSSLNNDLNKTNSLHDNLNKHFTISFSRNEISKGGFLNKPVSPLMIKLIS